MATKSIAFAFGRFNPPTIGHEKLMDMTRGANRNYRIYASQSQDAKRNPLTHTKKVKYMKDMFPMHKRKISRDKLVTAIDVLVKLYKEKYTDVIMIAGSDRVAEFDKLLQKYNGVKAKHGFYKFKSIRVVSAGERDPDSEGLSGMSASKMRKAAQDNKFGTFKQGLPRKYNGKELFKTVQKAMGTRTFEEFQLEAKKGPSEKEQDRDDFAIPNYPAQLHGDDDDGDWVEGDPTKPIDWKFKGDPVEKSNKQVVKDRSVWHKDPKTADDWKESIDEGGLAPDSPTTGPGLKLKPKVVFHSLKKKKDTGPTPADQLLPKNTVRRIESKLPSHLQKLVHKPKSKSKEIKAVVDDMKIGTMEAYQQSDASKEFQAKMAKRKAQVGRPKEPEKLSFFLKRARKAGYKTKKVEKEETYSKRISKPVKQGNMSGVGGTTVMPKVRDGVTEIDEIVFNKRAYDAAGKWYGKFKKRGDKPAVALHKAAGMVRGVKDKDLQTHLSKAKLL